MTTMKAIRMYEYGSVNVLQYEDAPRPVAGPGEVLVRVFSASVNPVDWKVRAGLMKGVLPLALPWVPGVDFSGRVESIGSSVTSFSAGEEVLGKTDLPRNGSYAEFVVVPSTSLIRKPRLIDHTHAAAIPLAALTAWQGLFGEGAGDLHAGQSVLILGAAGGVEGFAVQLARWRGAQVIAAGRANHEAHLRGLGVEAIINTDAKDLSAAGQVDLVLDLVGGELQKKAWKQLTPGGVFVSTVGAPSAEEARARGARAVGLFTKTNAMELGEIVSLVEKGTVKVRVTKTLPLASAAEAHKTLEAGGFLGKLVLTVR